MQLLKRKRILNVTSYKFCISTRILKLGNDNLHDSQLNPTTARIVCGVSFAHKDFLPSHAGKNQGQNLGPTASF